MFFWKWNGKGWGKKKIFFNLSTNAIIFAEASKLLNRKSMENFPYFPFTFLFASHKEIIDLYRESHSAHVASAWNLHTDLVSEYMMGSAFLGWAPCNCLQQVWDGHLLLDLFLRVCDLLYDWIIVYSVPAIIDWTFYNLHSKSGVNLCTLASKEKYRFVLYIASG